MDIKLTGEEVEQIKEEGETLLDAIAAEMYLPPRKPGDIDKNQLAAKTGRSSRWCDDQLKKRVLNGELLRVEVREASGRRLFVYRPRNG